MRITYIHHSGFLAELDHVLLLFDYVGGTLPELPKEKPLLVFSSHRHGDHFIPEIFELADRHPEVQYLLAFDIPKKKVPEARLGQTTFWKAGICESVRSADGTELARVHTYRSTDEGVAFMVEADGKTIYHAGDLNDWHWEGETKEYNNNMQANYLKELRKMKADGLYPDAAMVPVDGRLEGAFSLGLEEFLREVGAETVFPMHCWDDYSVITRAKALQKLADSASRIVEITAKGQSFEL